MTRNLTLLARSACFLALLCALLLGRSHPFLPQHTHKPSDVNARQLPAH